MSNQTPETRTPRTETPAHVSATVRKRVSRPLLVGAAAFVGLAAIGVGVVAAQDGRPFGMSAGMAGEDGMMHEARFGDRGGRMADFMEWRLERTLDGVDATPEQVERVKAIASDARDAIMPTMAEFRGTREDFAAIFGAETIDRAAAERLRAERLAAIDAASARGLEAMLDAAEVLTPEQRASLVEEMGERRRGWGRW